MLQSIFSKVKNELVKPFKKAKHTEEIKMHDLDPHQTQTWQANMLAAPTYQDFYEFDDAQDALAYLKMLPKHVLQFFSDEKTSLEKQKKLAFLFTQLTQLMFCLTEEQTFNFRVKGQYMRFVSPAYSSTQAFEYPENVWLKMSQKEVDKMRNNYDAMMAKEEDGNDHVHHELSSMINLFKQMTDTAKLKENMTFFSHSAQKEEILQNVLECKKTLSEAAKVLQTHKQPTLKPH